MPSTSPYIPASPLQRAVRAFGSLVLLTGLVVGLPVALALLAGNPLPGSAPTLDGFWSALVSPDDGTLFLSVLTVLGWLGWACFAGSVTLELFARVTRRPTPTIPGLGGPQRFAAVLVAAVATIAVTPTVTSASAAMVDSPPVAVAMTTPIDPGADERPGGDRQTASAGAPETVLHLVERGEGLLDLQDRYGVPWQRIAEANYGVEQPDGRSLVRGQTRIYPGWQLRIPVTAAAGPATDASGFGIVGVAGGGSGGAAGDATVDVAATPAGGPEAQAGSEEPAGYEYEVAEGDWMWHIADRYLGDPERYRDIAELNPGYTDRHGKFPDHIEPGWALRLPEDAVDSGATRHATGTATPAAPDPAPPDTPDAPDTPGPPETPDTPPAGEAGPDRAAPDGGQPDGAAPERAGLGTAPAPEAAAAPEHTGMGVAPGPDGDAGAGAATDGGGEAGDGEAGEGEAAGEPDLERLAPAALASAGLLAALVLGAAALHRHRRQQHHRSGFRLFSPAARRLEKTLRTAQQPLDSSRLDAALRQLAGGLAGREGHLPDVGGALIDDGSVHLLLGSPCPDPPAPWRDHGDRWTLPAGTALPAVDRAGGLAPLPALATVGSQAGIHLLLDLERLGFLTIHGDPVRGLDLLRYLAAELACNTWSDTAQVLLAGFEPYELELLTAVDPDRVQALPSIPEAVARVRHRTGSARTTLGHTGAGDAFSGRVRGLAGDAWMPQVLLAAASCPADLEALTELRHELTGGARCAVAVAVAGPNPPVPDEPEVTVTAEGAVHVRLPFLRASLAAAALPVAELAPLAETMRAARATRLLPVPPAPEPERWTVGTDAAGAVRGVGRATVGATGTPEEPTNPLPALPTVPVTLEADPSLDDDLRLWHADHCARPRVGILGPVSVDAPGTAPQIRRRLHAELIVYLAQRASRGADDRLIDAALWPDTRVAEAARQLTISRARSWLGTDPAGRPWLPDIGADLAYRLADGYLFDWHLFRRLRTRSEMRGAAGAEDLRAALALVRGVPLDGADRPGAPGTRNPYPWLAESDIHPDHLVATIVDTAHQLAERCLAGGDPGGARWAVQQAWLADPDRGYDQPWRDLLRAEHADGQTGRLRTVLAELMEIRDAERPEDLSPATYRLVSTWPPNVLVPTG